MIRHRQHWCVHDRLDTPQSGVGQHHTGSRKHNLGQCRGNDGREYGVEGEVCDKSRKITRSQCAGSQEQHHRHQKQKGALSKGQIDGLRNAAHITLIVLRLSAVLLNGLLKGLEGVDGLLKDLDHRDASYIFRASFGHTVLGRLVFRHKLGVFAAHHTEHGKDGDHRRQQACRTHTPIKHEHQHQHGKKQGDCAHDVRQIVSQQGFCIGGRCVQAAADQTGSIGIKIAQRSLHHMCHALFADVGRRAERRQMGAHQTQEVDEDAAHRESKGDPAIARHALGLRPIRRHGNQISGRQPDTEIGNHTAHHGYC